MREFLSNAWVVSIISGILVFFFTNSIIMLQNKRKHKKQINDANMMILNRLRGYVVDNGLPEKEILSAVKSSTAREYNIKYNELLSNKELCEELITDIIGNTYISNENKIKYIDMLQAYLKFNNNYKDNILNNNTIHDVKSEINVSRNNYLRKRKKGMFLKDIVFSLIPAVITIMSVFLSSYDKTKIDFSKFDIYSIFIEIIFVAIIPIIIGVILPQIEDIKKRIKKIIKRKKDNTQ